MRDADFDRRRRPEPDIGGQGLDVGKGIGHVARLDWKESLLRCSPQLLLEAGDEMHQLDRLVIADIVDAIWCA